MAVSSGVDSEVNGSAFDQHVRVRQGLDGAARQEGEADGRFVAGRPAYAGEGARGSTVELDLGAELRGNVRARCWRRHAATLFGVAPLTCTPTVRTWERELEALALATQENGLGRRRVAPRHGQAENSP